MKPVSRRSFLRQSSRLSAGFALAGVGGRVVLGANEMPHVALIGCGGRGTYVSRGIAAAGARVTTLCDLDAGRVEGVAKFLERFAPDTRFQPEAHGGIAVRAGRSLD